MNPVWAALALANIAKGVYQANAADPNRSTWDEMLKEAARLRESSKNRFGEAAVANIRNQSANTLNTLSSQFAGQPGQQSIMPGQFASVVSQGAGLENEALDAQRNWREEALRASSGLSTQAEGGRTAFRQARKDAAVESYLQGLTFGIGSFGGNKNKTTMTQSPLPQGWQDQALRMPDIGGYQSFWQGLPTKQKNPFGDFGKERDWMRQATGSWR